MKVLYLTVVHRYSSINVTNEGASVEQTQFAEDKYLLWFPFIHWFPVASL